MNQEAENTIKEILEEDKLEVKKRKRKGGCFLRLLIILTTLFIGVYGFILIRQKMLDLEARAIIFARQTATASLAEPQVNVEKNLVEAETESAVDAAPPLAEATPIPATATADPMTATLAAQLTSVAEFQLSRTPQP